MTALYWRKAGHGLYHLRTHDGLGPACGRVSSVPMPSGAAFYDFEFEHDGHHITLRERGMPNTVIRLAETSIREAIPGATFTKIGF